jgi:hypothetical protein
MKESLIAACFMRPLWGVALRALFRMNDNPGGKDRIVNTAWEQYNALRQLFPEEETVGARVMVRLAGMTAALYRAMLEEGEEPEEAFRKTAGVTWSAYRRLAAWPWKATRLLNRNPLARVKRSMDLFMKFPYRAPGYKMVYLPESPDVVSFRVTRCPAAEYFSRLGLSELCVHAFCNLDYPLADLWGVRLVRPHTLARGDAFCDFKFVSLESNTFEGVMPHLRDHRPSQPDVKTERTVRKE